MPAETKDLKKTEGVSVPRGLDTPATVTDQQTGSGRSVN